MKQRRLSLPGVLVLYLILLPAAALAEGGTVLGYTNRGLCLTNAKHLTAEAAQ